MVFCSGNSVANHFVRTSQGVIDNRVLGYCTFPDVGCAEKYLFLLGFFSTVPENQQWLRDHTKCHFNDGEIEPLWQHWSHWLRKTRFFHPGKKMREKWPNEAFL
jgi:hypothetical protein